MKENRNTLPMHYEREGERREREREREENKKTLFVISVHTNFK